MNLLFFINKLSLTDIIASCIGNNWMHLHVDDSNWIKIQYKTTRYSIHTYYFTYMSHEKFVLAWKELNNQC